MADLCTGDGALGAIMLALADDPKRNRVLVLIVSILELVRGAGGDLLWMLRGWPSASYIPFLLVHLLIAGTGLFLLRQANPPNAEF